MCALAFALNQQLSKVDVSRPYGSFGVFQRANDADECARRPDLLKSSNFLNSPYLGTVYNQVLNQRVLNAGRDVVLISSNLG